MLWRFFFLPSLQNSEIAKTKICFIIEMQKKNQWQSAVLSLICLLATVYTLSFSGKPITDDEQLFASSARNVDVLGRISAEQLYGNLRIKGDYHGVEPAHPVLASLWLKLFNKTEFGSVQILHLLSIIYSIISCILMLGLAKRWGYSVQAGLIITILYGISTLGWPYAKTFLREPFGGMLILGSWFFFVSAIQEKGLKKLIFFSTFLIFGIVLVLTKVIYGAIWISFIVMWFIDRRVGPLNKVEKSIFLATSLVIMCWLFYSWEFTDAELFFRISGGFLREVLKVLFHNSHSHFWETLFAQLFSPFKGLFIYTPSLALGIISLLLYWKNSSQLFVLPITALLAILLFQSLAYGSNWWTPTWGNRPLLPVIPLLLLASLPLIENLLAKKGGGFLLVIIFILGLVIQLPGVLFNSSLLFVRFYDYKSTIFSDVLWSFSKSPIFLQWKTLNLSELDLLIWRVFPFQPMYVIVFVIFAILLVIISLYWLNFDICNLVIPSRILKQKIIVISLFLPMLILGALNLGQSDPFYHSLELNPLCDMLHSQIRQSDAMIVYPYPSDLWDYFSNIECGQSVWYSLPHIDPEDSESQEAQMKIDLLSKLKEMGFSRLWVITQYDGGLSVIFENQNFILVDNGTINVSHPVYYSLYEIIQK